jgi:hypothetical protein
MTTVGLTRIEELFLGGRKQHDSLPEFLLVYKINSINLNLSTIDVVSRITLEVLWRNK